MTPEEMRGRLARRIEEAGGAARWARRHAVSPAYVGDVVAGRRMAGPAILRALGMRRVVTVDYEEAPRADA